MRSETESEFVAHRLHNVRRRFAAEETLDDRRAMEIIAEEVFACEEVNDFDDKAADRIIQKLFLNAFAERESVRHHKDSVILYAVRIQPLLVKHGNAFAEVG